MGGLIQQVAIHSQADHLHPSNIRALDPPAPQDKAIKQLSQKKNEIEAELEVQYGVLRANAVDMNSSLVDREGFPRSDVADLGSVRKARVKIHELRNDLRINIGELAEALKKVIPPDPGLNLSTPSLSEMEGPKSSQSSESLVPFAKVDMVSPGSPAATAGLEVNDQLLRLGPLNASTHGDALLPALAEIVNRSEGKPLDLVLFRYDNTQKRRLMCKTLVPRSGWGGRGLIGCHVVPL